MTVLPIRRQVSLFSSTAVPGSFKVLRELPIPELSVEAIEAEHVRTGAKFFHLRHSSPSAFSIAFRTLPSDSTGLPHILEHTALCGSKRFPVRDPFFKMLDRSLAVYMNAWTGADFTQYPFVSANRQDYRNLRSVYLDAVFNPLLERDDFLQEGWRFERNERTGRVEVAGVVYNEMKGALSDPDALFLSRLQQARFPGESVYSVVSGGDPQEIPKLTHADLVAFHGHFYHPSNSVTVSTGDDSDWMEDLRVLDEAFAPFERRAIDTGRLFVRPRLRQQQVTCYGPPDPLGDPQKQIRMLCSHLANRTADVDESFAMKILAELLFDGPASPFYQALIDSGLGSEYAPGTGYDCSTTHATLAVGLQGLREDAVAQVESVIYDTFRRVRRDTVQSLPRSRVESILHQLQLGLRCTPANFGLNLVAGVTQSWVHGADPLAALSIEAKTQTFLRRYEQGGLFEDLLDRYVLGPEAAAEGRLLFVMKPDPMHNARLKEAEDRFISRAAVDLSAIDQDSQRLRQKQATSGDLSLLPCLQLTDVPCDLKDPAVQPHPHNPLRFHNCTSQSNGLVYFRALFPLCVSSLTEREIKLIPLLLQAFAELGGRSRANAADFDCQVRANTGGLSFSCLDGVAVAVDGGGAERTASLSLLASSFAMAAKAEKMFALLQEPLLECNLSGDPDRLRTILTAASATLSSSIASAGSRFAALKASSLFGTEDAVVPEWLGGLAQAEFLDSLLREGGVDGLAGELERLREKLIGSRVTAAMRTFLISDEEASLASQRLVETFVSSCQHSIASVSDSDSASASVSTTSNSNNTATATATCINSNTSTATCNSNSNNTNNCNTSDGLLHQFIPGPFNSNFAALSLQLPPSLSPSQQAALSLTARLLRSKFLHREIRERGGAYGCGATFSPLTGRFLLTSFRDPQPVRSLDLFRASFDAIGRHRQDAAGLTEQDLLGAKLAVFSELDAPVQVSARGSGVFKYGAEFGGDERRRAVREALRRCSLSDIAQCIQSLLAVAPQRSCIIGAPVEE